MKLCVIPARGGSERIPRKSVRAFCGRPIIAYSIETARKADCFDRIIVSTDDAEIAELAEGYGAEAPYLRPQKLASDRTGTSHVVRHAIEWFRDRGELFEYSCCLYATAPFIQPRDITEGLVLLMQDGAKFAVTVTSFAFPIQRALRITRQNRVCMIDPRQESARSQDLEESFHDAGALYWGRSEAFLQGLSLFAGDTAPIRLPRSRVQDIDTIEDWHRAELMYQVLQQMSDLEA